MGPLGFLDSGILGLCDSGTVYVGLCVWDSVCGILYGPVYGIAYGTVNGTVYGTLELWDSGSLGLCMWDCVCGSVCVGLYMDLWDCIYDCR